jgi:myo-inositol-1(or 4)-monophosphatase
MLSTYTKFITEELTKAAEIAKKNFGSITTVTVKSGDNNQTLTETDLAIGSYLVERVRDVFPEHNIIDEEAGVIDNGSDVTWVIDPIDGTSNFAMGLPTFGVMMGVLEGGEAIAGGIHLPMFDQLYWGEKGQGAFCNGQPIQVSTKDTLLDCLIAYGIDGHQEAPEKTHKEAALVGDIVLAIRNLRTTNSAYDLCHVCDGKYGAILNQTTKIWDNVAVQPIIEAAGGVVTDFWGKPMDYSNPLQRIEENFTLCAGAPALHAQLQEIIAKS